MCRLLCEDYANRGSGVPDLIVWKTDERKSMFVEVKGPGDNLRENQRVSSLRSSSEVSRFETLLKAHFKSAGLDRRNGASGY